MLACQAFDQDVDRAFDDVREVVQGQNFQAAGLMMQGSEQKVLD